MDAHINMDIQDHQVGHHQNIQGALGNAIHNPAVQGHQGQPVLPPVATAQYVNLEMTKIPEFSDVPEKDAMPPIAFIQRLESAAKALGWSNMETYNRAVYAFRGSVYNWWNSMVVMHPTATHNWAWLKPLFKAQYVRDSEDTEIYNQLTDMRQKTAERPCDHLNRVIRVIDAMFDSSPEFSYNHDPDQPLTLEVMMDQMKQARQKLKDDFYLIAYRSSLRPEFQTAVKHIKPKTLMETYTLVNDQHNIEMDKKTATAVTSVTPSTHADQVEAIQRAPQQRANGNFRTNNGQRSFNRNQSHPQQNSGYNNRNSNNNGNNQQRSAGQNFKNQNKQKYCTYCHISGHIQDECRRRQRDNQPCRSAAGVPYWPQNVSALEMDEATTTIGGVSTSPSVF